MIFNFNFQEYTSFFVVVNNACFICHSALFSINISHKMDQLICGVNFLVGLNKKSYFESPD